MDRQIVTGNVTTRRALVRTIGIGAVLPLLAACGGADEPTDAGEEAAAADVSARFAGFEPADEPNGDLAKVIWPGWLDQFDPEVKRLYAFQVENGDLMRWMPCFCGCKGEDGHRNNRDCYVEAVNPDGSVVFDSMAPTWDVCLGVTRAVIEMNDRGMAPQAMRAEIDRLYADAIDWATPTPYPTA